MSNIKERPVLMAGSMAQGCHEGWKRQTRRPIVPQPLPDVPRSTETEFDSIRSLLIQYDMIGSCWNATKKWKCPFGKVGDRLWVRETWCHEMREIGIADDVFAMKEIDGRYRYRADGDEMYPYENDTRWKPSIHMPRCACRTVLEITGIRVERVQQISEEDAISEGVCDTDYYERAEHFQARGSPLIGGSVERCAFVGIWDSIYARRGFGWDANPWVWVIDLERVKDA